MARDPAGSGRNVPEQAKLGECSVAAVADCAECR